jgi:hypothetical protein
MHEECENYEKEIAKVGGIELFLSGIGTDGTSHPFCYLIYNQDIWPSMNPDPAWYHYQYHLVLIVFRAPRLALRLLLMILLLPMLASLGEISQR